MAAERGSPFSLWACSKTTMWDMEIQLINRLEIGRGTAARGCRLLVNFSIRWAELLLGCSAVSVAWQIAWHSGTMALLFRLELSNKDTPLSAGLIA